MAKDFFVDKRPHNGLTADDYREYFRQQVDVAGPNQEYTKLNFQRSSRIDRTYKVSDELAAKLGSLTEPQFWLIITEPWCGDSAQILPGLIKMAECSEHITLRMLLRDQNPDIIDQYLTNGGRAIPKLIAFDESGHETFTWGPRPQEAQQIMIDGKAEGLEKEDIYKKMHLWYARNKQKAVESEIGAILDSLG